MSIMLLHQSYQEAVVRDRIARSVPKAGSAVVRPRLAFALRAVAAWVAPEPDRQVLDGMSPRGPSRPRPEDSPVRVRRRPAHGAGPPGQPAGPRRREG